MVAIPVGAVALFSDVSRTRLLDGYLLFVGGVVALALVHATRLANPVEEESEYERALRRRRPGATRPRDLERIEREVYMSATTSFDFHQRMRPLLREIAAHRLASRRGLELDAGEPETRALLGDATWALLRPDREPPEDRFAPGLPLKDLDTAVTAIEKI
jgi:hypothetical protein